MPAKIDRRSKLISLLLGGAWALALIGAIYTFSSLIYVNLFTAVLTVLLGASPGLLMVLCLEYIILKSKKY